MTERDHSSQHDSQTQNASRGTDDRRNEVKPHENPAPSSPEPEEDAVREGEEKLGRVKPY
jgi:hypothetical protein